MDEQISLHRLSQTTLTDTTHPSHLEAPTYDHDTIGECIAPSEAFQFQRHSTASGETLHSGTHTRQTSRDSGLFSAQSLDSSAETICAPSEEDEKAAGDQGTGVPWSNTDTDTHRIALVDSHRFTTILRKCSHSAKLARSIRRVCSYRSRQSLPPPVAYSEPQYSLIGDIKTVRFDDCVTTPAAPCTDWDDVECQAVLVVGRDPTLPPLKSSRSSVVGGLRESRYGLNRLSQTFK